MNQSCGSIYSFVVHGHMLYAGTYENTVNIWDMRSYAFVRSLPGHCGAVYTLAVQGNRLFSGSYDNSIRVCYLFY
jgi:WD40 repeat protein